MREHPESIRLDPLEHQVGDHGGRRRLVDRTTDVVAPDGADRIGLGSGTELGRPVAVGIEDPGLHPAGTEARHADRETAAVHGVEQILGDRHDGMLARAVGRSEAREQPRDRGGVHDVTAAGGHEVREEGAGPVHDAPEVDAHRPLPGRQRSQPGLALRRYAGVVAHHVHGAEALHRGRGERLDLFDLADIAAHRQHGHAERLERCRGGGKCVVLDISDHE